MFPVRLYAFGKLKDPRLASLADEYSLRIQKMAKLDIKILKDGKATDPVSRLRDEALALKLAAGWEKSVSSDVVLFDEKGKDISTLALAKEIDNRKNQSRALILVLGSSHGVDPNFKKEISAHWRLSSLTLTHEWARALALEQVYRALTVLEGLPYHH